MEDSIDRPAPSAAEDRLRREVAESAEALARAREASRRKDQFLTTLSHELRTPLTSIRSFAEILLTQPEEDGDTLNEFLTIIHDESIRLTRLVTNLLDLDGMESGRMEWDFRKGEMQDAVHRATRSVGSLLAAKDLQLASSSRGSLPHLVFDRDKIVQVLVNLLSNAIEHTEPGGRITVLAGTRDGEARVVVRDEGPGIPAALRDTVFERYRRLDAGGERSRGSGLGLSISLAIVKAHGGSIWVDSSPVGGCDFTFQLPAEPPAGVEESPFSPLAETEVAPPAPGPGGRRVLVIDDDPNFRRFLRHDLAGGEFVMTEAPDGLTGILSARAAPPDLVILDLSMPGLSGADVLAVFRSDPVLKGIPVLLVAVRAEVPAAETAGIRGVLEKPLQPGRPGAEIARILGR